MDKETTKMRHRALRNAYRGAQYLDEYEANTEDPVSWRELIDLDRLNIRSQYDCILGQVYGDYTRGLRLARLFGYAPERYGFQFGENIYSDDLNDAWCQVLSRSN